MKFLKPITKCTFAHLSPQTALPKLMESNAKIFSGTGSRYLAEKIAKKFGEPLGNVNIQRFSDGEIGVEFMESIRGKFVFLIQSTFAPTDNMMELLLMIDAAK